MGPRRSAGRAQWSGLRGARRAARQEGVPLPPPSRGGRVILRRVRRGRISVRRHDRAGSQRRHCRGAGWHAAAQLINIGSADLCYLGISTMGEVDIVDYPDSKKIALAAVVKNADFKTATYAGVGRLAPADYFDGEDA